MNDMSNKLLKTSENDLKASKLLYKEEIYPQAVSHFQQSIEKSNKAFGLVLNIINDKALISQIGHKPLKIHSLMIQKQKRNFENYKKFMEQNIIVETSIIKRDDIKGYIKD